MSAGRRIFLGLVVTAVLSTAGRAQADDEAPDDARPYEHRPNRDPEPSRVHVSTSALMMFGSLAGLPVTRGGAAIEVRTRYVSGGALLELGTTPNGLGAHRIEIGGNLTSPLEWLRASIGPHVGYAMLVRTTETHALWNAIQGDIASFSIGMHASIELSAPLTERVRLFAAVRGMGELYRRRQGWEIGPTIGLHF